MRHHLQVAERAFERMHAEEQRLHRALARMSRRHVRKAERLFERRASAEGEREAVRAAFDCLSGLACLAIDERMLRGAI